MSCVKSSAAPVHVLEREYATCPVDAAIWPPLVPGLEQPRNPGTRARAWDSPGTAPGHPGTNFFSQNQTKKAKKGPNEHLKPAHAAGRSRGNPFRPPGAVLQAGTPEHPGTAKQVPGEAGGAPKWPPGWGLATPWPWVRGIPHREGPAPARGQKKVRVTGKTGTSIPDNDERSPT